MPGIIKDIAAVPYPRIPYEVRHAAINNFTIPWSISDYWFDKYYLLLWDGTYLFDQVKEGVLIHDKVRYNINWIDTPAVCFKSNRVAVSFRRILSFDEGYALIKIWHDKIGD